MAAEEVAAGPLPLHDSSRGAGDVSDPQEEKAGGGAPVPRRGFHLILAVATALLLYSESTPAGVGWAGGFAFPSLVVLALVWLLALVACLRSSHRPRGNGSMWWFAVAPVTLIAVIMILSAELPLRARWGSLRGPFDAVVASAPPPSSSTESIEFEAPERVGDYEISAAYRIGDGVILYRSSYLQGLAYLPSGPFKELDRYAYGNFTPIDSGWYTWSFTF